MNAFFASALKKTLLHSGVFSLLLLTTPFSLAQPSANGPINGERLDFVITYEWGPLYLEVGNATFTTLLNPNDPRSLWSFEGWGTSQSHWNWFYPVNSIYSSTADKHFQPHQFSRKGIEGSHAYDRAYQFNEGFSISWIGNDDELSSGEVTLFESKTTVMDVMTAVHWCRQIPWDTYSEGKVLKMDLILDGEIHQTNIQFLGIETWTDPDSHESYECWIIQPQLIEGTVFKAGDLMQVFVTADEQRLPVFIETELIIGSAKIFLTDHSILSPSKIQGFRAESVVSRNQFFSRKK